MGARWLIAALAAATLALCAGGVVLAQVVLPYTTPPPRVAPPLNCADDPRTPDDQKLNAVEFTQDIVDQAAPCDCKAIPRLLDEILAGDTVVNELDALNQRLAKGEKDGSIKDLAQSRAEWEAGETQAYDTASSKMTSLFDRIVNRILPRKSGPSTAAWTNPDGCWACIPAAAKQQCQGLLRVAKSHEQVHQTACERRTQASTSLLGSVDALEERDAYLKGTLDYLLELARVMEGSTISLRLTGQAKNVETLVSAEIKLTNGTVEADNMIRFTGTGARLDTVRNAMTACPTKYATRSMQGQWTIVVDAILRTVTFEEETPAPITVPSDVGGTCVQSQTFAMMAIGMEMALEDGAEGFPPDASSPVNLGGSATLHLCPRY